MKLKTILFLILLIGGGYLLFKGNLLGGNSMTTATFETSLGTFKIELFTEEMPLTTKNFIDLAEKGFYNGQRFHRVIENFMIQGGDPLTKNESMQQFWGTGGPGYKIEDEFSDEFSNLRGTLAMANSGPNTGGSQFFINVADNIYLDSKHPVFGKVVVGMEIVEAISKVEADEQDRPIEEVVVEIVKIG